MPLIVETDVGRDPDDFFALCYLISAGADIRAITISPGDPDQVAVASFLLAICGLDIPIGVGKKDRNKTSSGGVHYELLDKYKYPRRQEADGYGPDIIKSVDEPCELFAIGPLMSVGPFLRDGGTFLRATMQGGFLPYSLHDYGVHRLDKFEGKDAVPTFNLNGDKKSAEAFVAADFKKRFVSKNLCHTLVYDGSVHKKVMGVEPQDRASMLLREGMEMYLRKHPSGKKFHDPTAAVCHLHPEIAIWLEGVPVYSGGKWGWGVCSSINEIIVDVERVKLWQHIVHGV